MQMDWQVSHDIGLYKILDRKTETKSLNLFLNFPHFYSFLSFLPLFPWTLHLWKKLLKYFCFWPLNYGCKKSFSEQFKDFLHTKMHNHSSKLFKVIAKIKCHITQKTGGTVPSIIWMSPTLKDQGWCSQNFLRKFVKITVTLGLNILSFLRLKVFF